MITFNISVGGMIEFFTIRMNIIKLISTSVNLNFTVNQFILANLLYIVNLL